MSTFKRAESTSEHLADEPRRLSIAMVGLRGIPATYGGVEAAVEALSKRLVERGHAVTVYARKAYSDSREPVHEGVAIRHLGQVNTKHLEAASHTALAVADAIRSRRFDVIHFHATGPALFSVLPRLAGVPSVATIHGLDWQREKWGPLASGVLRVGARVAATVPSRTIVVSRPLQEEIRRRYDRSAAYIPNGIDPSDFEPTEPVAGLESDRYVLFLGRLVPEKGVHTLIEAFAMTDLDHRLAIVGPDSHSRDYVERVRGLAAGDPRVLMMEPRYGAEKAWLLRNAALYVQPSTLEGLPITLMEAAACGRFSVVSDIPPNLEVMGDEDPPGGLSFRAGDPGDLAAKLNEALADPRRHAGGAAAQASVVRRFDWARIAEETEREYLLAVRGR